MTSSRPYLIRGLYEWINDNRLTAHIIVNTEWPDVSVPSEFVKDGKIVFNISPEAVYHLHISNTELEFNASFGGVSRHIIAPIAAINAIYAQENGEGMVFGDEPGGEAPPDATKHANPKSARNKKPFLKVVK